MAWNSPGEAGWLAAVSFPPWGSQGQAIMPGFFKTWVGYGGQTRVLMLTQKELH